MLFEGADPEATTLIQSTSRLYKLREASSVSALVLKKRAESDISSMVKALHSLAYYEAKVNFSIQEGGSSILIQINPGPVYTLNQITLNYFQHGEQICNLKNVDLALELGEPALPEKILNAEELLILQLKQKGYAQASIRKRELFADLKAKHAILMVEVEIGPLCYFGGLQIKGLERVKESYFHKKLLWKSEERFDPLKIEKTQEALELSGLFRSVKVAPVDDKKRDCLLPIEIEVVEAKQRSVGLGLNYTSALGPGITAEWEDRNIFGEGQRLGVRADAWARLQDGTLSYLIPDFKQPKQNLIWLLNYRYERIKAYTESALSISATIERHWSDRITFSYGLMYKLLRSERSERNGTFDLFKIPLKFLWNYADSLLEPTEGFTVQFKAIPSLQLFSPSFAYSIQTLTATFYKRLTKDSRHILATKLHIGSIVGANRRDIPTPERFFAGSENTLRGYHYETVSPLTRNNKPIGGRSILVYSLELRNRIGTNFGYVLFYDIGNVYENAYIDLSKPLLQSTGIGLRYHTPIGPLRLDVAVPLNRRRGIDAAFEVYFSIGQSF